MYAKQPYSSWKGNVWGVVNGNGQYFKMRPESVPTFSNINQSDSLASYDGPFGKPRPLKIYRKRLLPVSTPISKASIGNIMDIPGGTTALKISPTDPCAKCADENTNFILNYYGPKPECNRCYKLSCGDSGSSSYRCTRSSEGNIGFLPASTNVSKRYYQSMSSYLRSRGKTYDQNLSRNAVAGNNYNNPSEQVYNMGTCEVCPQSSSTTVFKPNNKKFSVQGAVSSSSRTDRLKLDASKTTANSWLQSSVYQNTGSGPQMKKFLSGQCHDC